MPFVIYALTVPLELSVCVEPEKMLHSLTLLTSERVLTTLGRKCCVPVILMTYLDTLHHRYLGNFSRPILRN